MTAQQHTDLSTQILALGAANTGFTPVSELVFHDEFRAICESNTCGMFNRCWTCPPHVGDKDTLMNQVRTFSQVLVYQTISDLEDSFDIEGMLDAGKRQNQLARKINGHLHQAYPDVRFLHVGAGGCRMCERCAILDDLPCRLPQEALSSLEAYCIDVSKLAISSGMNYINGQNTVTYFGAIFL